MLNLELKAALVRHYGSQVRASKELGIHERKLSRLIHGYDQPSPREREIIKKLGVKLDSERKKPNVA